MRLREMLTEWNTEIEWCAANGGHPGEIQYKPDDKETSQILTYCGQCGSWYYKELTREEELEKYSHYS